MYFRVLAVTSLITLGGCHFQADPPGDAPSNVQVTAGDGQVVVIWDQQPELTYWIFYQPGSSVTPAAPGVPLVFGAISPRVVTGLVNETQYAFIMNATNNDSKAGPNSPVMRQTPRLAGDTWNSGTAFTTTNLNGIAFNGSRLVVVGDSATIFAGDYNYTSTNPPGVTAWMPASLPVGFSPGSTTGPTLSAGMNGIAFGFVSGVGTYVVVGDGGAIFTSTDLVTWTPATSGTGKALFSISLLNGSFVATGASGTGASGTLLTSTDGTTWTSQTSNTPNALRGAAFRSSPNGLYVVVGDAGTIVTSADGTNWTATTLPGAQHLRGVTNGGVAGARFLAVGLGGAVVFSDDGSTWSSPSTLPGPSDLSRVIFTPAMYVAVGATGANAFAK